MKKQATKKQEHTPYAWYEWGNEAFGMVSVWWRDAVSGDWGNLPSMTKDAVRAIRLPMECPYN